MNVQRKKQRLGTKATSRGGKQIAFGADAQVFFGGNFKWMLDRILRGGSSGHPLSDPSKYRWEKETDTYVFKPSDKIPALRLFRRTGEWRITFDAPGLDGDTHLFKAEHLNEPVYTLVALLYAAQTATYPNLRNAAIQRIMEPTL